jgi:putative membrane protein
MKNLIRGGLAAGIAGALALGGIALAQGIVSLTGGGASARLEPLDPKLQTQLEKIHADNQAALQLGKLGAQNAQSPEVKQLAAQMQSDHQKFDSGLVQAARDAGTTLDGKDYHTAQQDTAKNVQKLQSKTGKDFDKAFVSVAVKDHEEDVKAMKQTAEAAQKANQPALASLLQAQQIAVQSHLDHAKHVQQSLEKGGSHGAESTGSGGSTPPHQN